MNCFYYNSKNNAVSIFELLFSILVIGIILLLIFPVIVGKQTTARSAIASAKLEELNRAVQTYSMAGKAIDLPAGSDSQVLNLLKQRSENVPGSPFLPHINYSISSDTSTFRAKWNGKNFELLSKGQEGTGLDLQVR
ncbi:MAG: hypothetical protein N2035_07715 [Chthoniobacterales bacterium]|nr:hypothetical protein [Chthoniobacterales bacterium]MCX7713530.1 hypothetical protein [Chthoniobacterales bacterium]